MTIAEAKSKLVAIARGQLGYKEGGNNYTKYAADPMITRLYGWTPQNQPWCCTFVNWAFLTAFGFDLGSKLTYGGTAACASSAQLFKNNGAWVHFPEIGDQAFYYSGGGINHTGIVVAVDGTAFTAIEGNYSDKVASVKHNVGDSSVAGFGRPNWKLVETDAGQIDQSSNPEITREHDWKPPTLGMSNAYNTSCVVLQAILNVRHFPCGSADGIYGPKTQAAVNAAQKFYNLTVDGICGPQTWGELLKVGD